MMSVVLQAESEWSFVGPEVFLYVILTVLGIIGMIVYWEYFRRRPLLVQRPVATDRSAMVQQRTAAVTAKLEEALQKNLQKPTQTATPPDVGRKLGDFTTFAGKTKGEIIAVAGQPSNVTELPDGRQLVQWTFAGLPLTLVFDSNGVYQGLSDKSIKTPRIPAEASRTVAPPSSDKSTVVKFCKSCGRQLNLVDIFCDRCGTRQPELSS